jgi:large subunit ribosomal protein L25
MTTTTLSAQHRNIHGRKTRQLRNTGLVPVVVYGRHIPSASLQVESRQLERAFHASGYSQLVQLNVEGASDMNVFIRAVHRHPVSHKLLHADFYAVDMSEKQRVHVPIVAVGKPESLAGGLFVYQSHDNITVESLPTDIPQVITVDISGLTMDNPIYVSELPELSGVRYLMDAHEPIFSLIASRVSEEAEAAATGTPEPEVVSAKAKKEDA